MLTSTCSTAVAIDGDGGSNAPQGVKQPSVVCMWLVAVANWNETNDTVEYYLQENTFYYYHALVFSTLLCDNTAAAFDFSVWMISEGKHRDKGRRNKNWRQKFTRKITKIGTPGECAFVYLHVTDVNNRKNCARHDDNSLGNRRAVHAIMWRGIDLTEPSFHYAVTHSATRTHY